LVREVLSRRSEGSGQVPEILDLQQVQSQQIVQHLLQTQEVQQKIFQHPKQNSHTLPMKGDYFFEQQPV
jgi:hypothetical protein